MVSYSKILHRLRAVALTRNPDTYKLNRHCGDYIKLTTSLPWWEINYTITNSVTNIC